MAKLITKCPSCEESEVVIRNVACCSCGTKFEGNFQIPSLLRLSGEELSFVDEFVRASGSLKEMAKKLGVSYPTVRNRLNSVIANLESLSRLQLNSKSMILADLESGKISAAEAEKRLKGI